MPIFQYANNKGGISDVNANDVAGALATPDRASNSGVKMLTPTSLILSSKDLVGSYNSDLNTLANKTTPTAITSTQTQTKSSDTSTPNDTSNSGTGNAILDKLMADKATKEAQARADAEKQITESKNALSASLAAVDSTYAAKVSNTMATYQAALQVQERINQLSEARTSAYGTMSKNALRIPMEFSNAIQLRVQEGQQAILKLDNARNAELADAMAARDNGDAQALKDSLARESDIRKEMQSTLDKLSSDLSSSYDLLTKATTAAQDKLKEQNQGVLMSQANQYFDQFKKADNKGQDAIIQKILGTLDGTGLNYTDVYNALTGLTKTASDAEKNAAQLAQIKASTDASKASAANAWKKYNNTDTGGTSDFKPTAGDKSMVGTFLSTDEGKKLNNGKALTADDLAGVMKDPVLFYAILNKARQAKTSGSSAGFK